MLLYTYIQFPYRSDSWSDFSTESKTRKGRAVFSGKAEPLTFEYQSTFGLRKQLSKPHDHRTTEDFWSQWDPGFSSVLEHMPTSLLIMYKVLFAECLSECSLGFVQTEANSLQCCHILHCHWKIFFSGQGMLHFLTYFTTEVLKPGCLYSH